MDTYDFGDGHGPVPANRHTNPNGTVGGWVQATASVAATAYLGPDALIYGRAEVYGKAQVFGRAVITDDARIQSPDDCLWGTAAGHQWAAYRTNSGIVVTQGCQTHSLAHWLENIDELAGDGGLSDLVRQAAATLEYIQMIFSETT